MDDKPPPSITRHGSLLVVSTGASLPEGCVKCNGPEACRKRVRLRWQSPLFYIILLSVLLIGPLALLLYVIVSAILGKRARIQVGLCARHRRIRRTHMLIGTLASLAGVAIIAFSSFVWEDLTRGLVGVGLLFAGVVYLNFAVPILRVKKFEGRDAYVHGCSPEFLAALTPQCSTCGYDMRGHQGDGGEIRCPECGAIA